jgi:hypothetical protein
LALPESLCAGQIRTLPPSVVNVRRFENAGPAVNFGVWMSSGVLAHKRDASAHAAQAWNMKALPDALSHSPDPHWLFVAMGGQWRGYFVLKPWVLRNPQDRACPWTVVFDATSWTTIPPRPAPPRDRTLGYTLNVPDPSSTELGERNPRGSSSPRGNDT